MGTRHGEGRGAQQGSFWRQSAVGLVELALITVTVVLVQFTLAHFTGFQKFEERHGFWAYLLPISLVVLVTHFFRRKQRLEELTAYRNDLRAGRVARMSLASRCAVMLIALVLAIAGPIIQGPYGTTCLLIGVPTLMLFALEELVIILRPGSFVFPDPHDELLAFFRARTLQ